MAGPEDLAKVPITRWERAKPTNKTRGQGTGQRGDPRRARPAQSVEEMGDEFQWPKVVPRDPDAGIRCAIHLGAEAAAQ